jgi:hypothetical protein
MRGRPKKPHGQFRLSQLVTTYGPGASADLPKHSVLIGGLEQWTPGPAVAETRLVAKIQQLFPNLQNIRLHSPPPAVDEEDDAHSGVGVWLFPEWFLSVTNLAAPGSALRSRRLVHRKNLIQGKYQDDARKKHEVVPVRFVRACVHGHIDDIDWYRFVHPNEEGCRRPLWLDERGTSGDASDIVVRCDCGKQRPISVATVRESEALGWCNGKRPWLGRNERESCSQKFRLLIRTASNAYFTQSLNVISLPDPEELVGKAVDAVWEDFLQYMESKDELRRDRQRKEKVMRALEGFSDDQVWAFMEARRSGGRADRSVKQQELEVLAASVAESGVDRPEGDFYARALPKELIKGKHSAALEKVVLVHRLREVQALVGFTRFEAMAPSTDGELEAGVQRAALAREPGWFPAIETRGEGIFLHFRNDWIDAWAKKPAVVERRRALSAGFEAWLRDHPQSRRQFCDIEYLMLHSLSHLLITAVSLSCGYPASSIRERIYARPEGCGILLYTATSDAEGTLGGLVEVGRNIDKHLAEALEVGRLCSNDPVCAQHEASDPHEQRYLHGAACHGCLLISETSCEMRNDFLDRSLVVPTVGGDGAAFFDLDGA